MTRDWDKFQHLFQRQEFPAKTILLEEGQISRTMFFIEKGCLRTWVNNDGKDITTQFFFEGDKVASIESFRTNQPSLYSIENLEPQAGARVSRVSPITKTLNISIME